MELEQQRQAHTMTLEGRARARVTGVMAVSCFNEQEVALITEAGELHVEGSELHMTKLNLDDGQVVIEGEVYALEYADSQESKGSLFSRMFR